MTQFRSSSSRFSCIPRMHALYSLTLTVAMALAVSSCGTSGKTVLSGRDARATTVADKPAAKPAQTHIRPSADMPRPASALLSEADKWMGTPYRWGGNDREGVDCSGFVTQVYLKALGIKLPRTSKTQHEYCTPIDRDRLQPGDLVFFATTREGDRVSHVGMYIGDGKMVHSSSSRGVVVSGLNEKYYTKTYFGAGRVESYYAMIDNDRQKKSQKSTPAETMTASVKPAASPKVVKPKKKQSETASAKPKKQPTVTAVAKPNKKTGETKVAKPEKQAQQKPAVGPKQVAKPAPRSTSPVVIPARTNNEVVASAATNAVDARASFLNSIIEQKADSIFSK